MTDPEALIRLPVEEEVEFVRVGGVAATYRRAPDNMNRLAEMEALLEEQK